MELFGYVCSPFCASKAEAQGVAVPVYAGQRSVSDRRHWRKVLLAGATLAALAIAGIGFWIWYAWIAVAPRPVFSLRFPEAARNGQAMLVNRDQLVYLRGDQLARHDINSNQEIWSRRLIDDKKIQEKVTQEIREAEAEIRLALMQNREYVPDKPDPAKLTEWARDREEFALNLHVVGSNIWLVAGDRVARCDWTTGKESDPVLLKSRYPSVVRRADELVVADVYDSGETVVTRINLVSGQTHVDRLQAAALILASTNSANAAGRTGGAGLPLKPGAARNQPMDPALVAQQASRLSYAQKLALPAILAASMNQERALAEMDDDEDWTPSAAAPASPSTANRIPERTYEVPGPSGSKSFSVRLLEERKVARQAMKEPPGKSALESGVNASQTLEIANEILNEIQRNRGGATVIDDLSRYQVTVRDSKNKETPDWTGEVEGRPILHPLESVCVLTAGKRLVVLDNANRKLWESPLTYEVKRASYRSTLDSRTTPALGPCVEKNGRLIVFDEGVLTGFDLRTGNALWRIPSVGVSGLFFDDEGMMYVNTTTGNPEDIKYSRQVDVTRKVSNLVIKIDPDKGKTLWTSDPGITITYMSGKYIYDLNAVGPGDDEEEVNPNSVGLESGAQFWVRRLNPKTGRIMGQRLEQRGPLDVKFDGDTIQVMFRKEIEILRCFSL